MAGMFDIKFPDFKKIIQKTEKAVNAAMASTLNDMAFAWRNSALAVLSGEYTIRSPAFASRQLRVTKKAKASEGGGMEAKAASLEEKNFSGWSEPMGKPGRRRRTITMNARGGNPRAVVHQRNRLQPGAHYIDVDDLYQDLPEKSRLAATIKTALKANPQARMILHGAGFPRGLYAPSGRAKISPATGKPMPHVHAVQLFDRPPEKTKPFDWAGKALEKVDNGFISASLLKNLSYYMKKYFS
jgi:hypothetical protein